MWGACISPRRSATGGRRRGIEGQSNCLSGKNATDSNKNDDKDVATNYP